jgi:hypothetical protein
MRSCAKSRDLELLARMAARLAGRVPGRRVTIRIGDMVAFDDAAWRYPDFLIRAEAAYQALAGDLPTPVRIDADQECSPKTHARRRRSSEKRAFAD